MFKCFEQESSVSEDNASVWVPHLLHQGGIINVQVLKLTLIHEITDFFHSLTFIYYEQETMCGDFIYLWFIFIFIRFHVISIIIEGDSWDGDGNLHGMILMNVYLC